MLLEGFDNSLQLSSLKPKTKVVNMARVSNSFLARFPKQILKIPQIPQNKILFPQNFPKSFKVFKTKTKWIFYIYRVYTGSPIYSFTSFDVSTVVCKYLSCIKNLNMGKNSACHRRMQFIHTCARWHLVIRKVIQGVP